MTKSTMGNKAPCPPAISIDMAVRQCNTKPSPGLLWKPLDAAIRRLLTPYFPGSRQGNNQQNHNVKYPPFAGHFDGHGGALVLYRALRPMEEVHGFPKSHLYKKPLDTTIGWVFAPYCPGGCHGHQYLFVIYRSKWQLWQPPGPWPGQ